MGLLAAMDYVCKQWGGAEEGGTAFRNPDMVLIQESFDDQICIPRGHQVFSTDAREILGPWLDYS